MPEALRNYLLRLGWSYKDKEIFTLEESIKYFSLKGVGKSPSKLDMNRILSMNETYIKNMDESELFIKLKNYCHNYKKKLDEKFYDDIKRSINFLKNKAKTIDDIYKNSQYIIEDKISIDKEDLKLLDKTSKTIIKEFILELEKENVLNKVNLEKIIKQMINKHKTNFKGVGQPIRIALTGSKFGPGIYDIILSIKKDQVIKRLKMID
ncbi:MAG: hypothetical protein CBC24_00100 [Candidatus Pelagibacter sp. TMED64]|nr:hypothetical protein [Candidatus Pelagibacter sp.]OUU67985.1 MAG: hypothetical protein CBC24_00100 [Candidatus Pelagibacter sp. TMED64]